MNFSKIVKWNKNWINFVISGSKLTHALKGGFKKCKLGNQKLCQPERPLCIIKKIDWTFAWICLFTCFHQSRLEVVQKSVKTLEEFHPNGV